VYKRQLLHDLYDCATHDLIDLAPTHSERERDGSSPSVPPPSRCLGDREDEEPTPKRARREASTHAQPQADSPCAGPLEDPAPPFVPPAPRLVCIETNPGESTKRKALRLDAADGSAESSPKRGRLQVPVSEDSTPDADASGTDERSPSATPVSSASESEEVDPDAEPRLLELPQQMPPASSSSSLPVPGLVSPPGHAPKQARIKAAAAAAASVAQEKEASLQRLAALRQRIADSEGQRHREQQHVRRERWASASDSAPHC
jgi:hypothetical protein